MLSLGGVVAVVLLVCLPVETMLSGLTWLRRLTGGGRFHRKVITSVSFYMPLLLLIACHDLSHEAGARANLQEYVLTIMLAVLLLGVFELLEGAYVRARATRTRQGASDH
ncbi:hypothetical protein FIU86_06295 [Roseovarius sp. THAF9]|uniref:hypothetical protein n=1 Tax=Roseovarius sp. THAF9 TaxID=2587847 RepID=UPI0012690103|nr:hypothetical protein [Roseovarius sp. THAF9]QFT92445.1 hypothetical protein FIU86_06295 [Roseovarius sp. THAF9]